MHDDRGSTICYPLRGIAIDPDRLVADLHAVESERWTSQERYQAGTANWKGLCLYSISGTPDDLRRHTGHDNLEDAFVALASVNRGVRE